MSITTNENLEYPEPEAKDVVADNVIDGVTNPLTTLAHAFVDSLREDINDRRDQFFHGVAAKLHEHDSRLSDLEAGPKHVSAIYQLCDTFVRTHDLDKKRVLVNAASNVLIRPPDSELEENEFLEFLGRPSFNVYHIRLLRLFGKEDKEIGQSGVGGSLRIGSGCVAPNVDW